MNKHTLVMQLLENFTELNPNASQAERNEVFARLYRFSISDLELLISQIKKNSETAEKDKV